MLRKEIIDGVEALNFALEESGVSSLLKGSRQESKNKKNALEVFRSWNNRVQNFGEIEKKIITIFGLDHLYNLVFWEHVIQSGSEGVSFEMGMGLDLRGIQIYAPQIVQMLKRDEVKVSDGADINSEQKLTFLVIEEDVLSTSKRLIYALESAQGFYDVASSVMEVEGSSLMVAHCDSGSDKSFDFIGAAKIIDCVKQLILDLWDRVVYYRENKSEKHIKLISDSLPIYAKIEELRESGAMEREKAELMKRQLEKSVTKFIKAGITTPEINQHVSNNPRKLLSPERKLLGISPNSQLALSEAGDESTVQENVKMTDKELLNAIRSNPQLLDALVDNRPENDNENSIDQSADKE